MLFKYPHIYTQIKIINNVMLYAHIYIYYIHLLVLVPCNMVRLDRSVFSIVVGDVKKPWGFRFPLPLGVG